MDDDGLERIPDPDFARLPADYGEDDSEGNEVFIYEGPFHHISPDMVNCHALITRYGAALDQMQGKIGILGARRPEPEEIEAMRQELLGMGLEQIDGVYVFGGEKAWAQFKTGKTR